jgi:membrane protein implicated in regulation of membrane protease activity
VRPASTTLTAGAGNPVLSFAEDVASAVLSILGVLVPLLGVLLLLVVAAVAVLWWRRVTRRRRRARA